MASYDELIEAAIRKEIEVLGREDAMNVAHEVEGLEVEEDGTVQDLDREGKKVLGELVEKYQEVGGSVSASLIAREIHSIIEDEEVQLPEILQKRMRAEKFASAL